MTDPSTPNHDDEPSGVAEIKAEVERARAELAETVDQLSDKLNVKSQVGTKAGAVKAGAADKAAQVKAAAPEPVRHALDTAAEKVAPVAHQVNEQARPHRSKILAGLAAAIVLVVVVRRRRR